MIWSWTGACAAMRRARSSTKPVQLGGGDDPVDEPDRGRVGGGDDVGEEGELLGPVEADEAGQQPGAAAVEGQAPPGEDLREAGGVGGDDEVTAEREVAARAVGAPFTAAMVGRCSSWSRNATCPTMRIERTDPPRPPGPPSGNRRARRGTGRRRR